MLLVLLLVGVVLLLLLLVLLLLLCGVAVPEEGQGAMREPTHEAPDSLQAHRGL